MSRDTLNKAKRNKIRPVSSLVWTGRFCFIQRFPRILGQFDRDFGHGDTVHAEISYYIIGQSGVESERLPDEFGCDIVSHLDAAVQYADLLEERSLTIDFGDYEMSF